MHESVDFWNSLFNLGFLNKSLTIVFKKSPDQHGGRQQLPYGKRFKEKSGTGSNSSLQNIKKQAQY